MSEEILPMMVEKCLEEYVTPFLDATSTATTKFDLWMNKKAHDTFAFVINFLTPQWEPCHVCVGLFEVDDTTRVGLTRQMKDLLEKFKLTSKILCFAKDEGTNLGTMVATLRCVLTCEALKLDVPFDGSYFGHAMSKVAQYATYDEKVAANLAPMNIKSTQASLQGCITRPKKLGKP
jgi:hypothetical protein